MNSAIGERSSHPSAAQVEALLDYLERKPELAKGFSRSAGAKSRTHKEWERLSLKLNSIGGGTIKSSKKWIKYWADKKNAIKRKAANRNAVRSQTGGGVAQVCELSDLEERILTIMGGENFAVGDRHLQIQLLDEQMQEISPSILQLNTQNIDQQSGVVSNYQPVEHIEVTTVINQQQSLLLDQCINSDRTDVTQSDLQSVNPRFLEENIESVHPIPTSSQTVAQERNTPPASHHRNATLTTPRRLGTRRIRTSPPSQRRTQFLTITEKFLRLEEARLEMNRRIVTVLETAAERDIIIAKGMQAMGEGMKSLAEALKKD